MGSTYIPSWVETCFIWPGATIIRTLSAPFDPNWISSTLSCTFITRYRPFSPFCQLFVTLCRPLSPLPLSPLGRLLSSFITPWSSIVSVLLAFCYLVMPYCYRLSSILTPLFHQLLQLIFEHSKHLKYLIQIIGPLQSSCCATPNFRIDAYRLCKFLGNSLTMERLRVDGYNFFSLQRPVQKYREWWTDLHELWDRWIFFLSNSAASATFGPQWF